MPINPYEPPKEVNEPGLETRPGVLWWISVLCAIVAFVGGVVATSALLWHVYFHTT